MWVLVRHAWRAVESTRGPCRQCMRHATRWEKGVRREKEREEIVFQYAGKHSQKSERLYVWGYAAVGALG